MSEPTGERQVKLFKKHSFQKKSSMISISKSGEEQRPNISRITSQEN